MNSLEAIDGSKKIFSALQDDMSKYVYEKYLMWRLTGDFGYVFSLANKLSPFWSAYWEYFKNRKPKKVLLYTDTFAKSCSRLFDFAFAVEMPADLHNLNIPITTLPPTPPPHPQYIIKSYENFLNEYDGEDVFIGLESEGKHTMIKKKLISDGINAESIFSTSLFYLSNIYIPIDEISYTLKGNLLYGYGYYGKSIADNFGFLFDYCIDTHKSNIEESTIPVVSFEDFIKKDNGKKIFISSFKNYEEIFSQLVASGVCSDRICTKHRERQYFDYMCDEFNLHCGEIFVDCGSFDGIDSLNFAQCANGDFHAIYAFEIDSRSMKLIHKNFIAGGLDMDKVKLINKGVHSHTGILRVYEDTFNAAGSRLIDRVDLVTKEIEVVSLDDFFSLPEHKLQDHRMFIKMDIEGAELEALKGARKIISEHKPKLAICMYHKAEDMFEIPKLLLQYRPDYKFWLRKYRLNQPFNEVVLFAS
jgi:FkbM family methyltransferase